MRGCKNIKNVNTYLNVGHFGTLCIKNSEIEINENLGITNVLDYNLTCDTYFNARLLQLLHDGIMRRGDIFWRGESIVKNGKIMLNILLKVVK